MSKSTEPKKREPELLELLRSSQSSKVAGAGEEATEAALAQLCEEQKASMAKRMAREEADRQQREDERWERWGLRGENAVLKRKLRARARKRRADPPKPARKAKRPKRMAQSQVDAAVRELLKNQPNATVREAAAIVGCSVGAVSKAPDWRAVANARKARVKGRAGPLTQAILDGAQAPPQTREEQIASLAEEQRQDEKEDLGIRRVRKKV